MCVEVGIGVLWVILSSIDYALVVLNLFLPRCPAPKKNLPKVVIVGASFAGLGVLRELGHHLDEVEVTLVDCKDYFEYVPGALRCLVRPAHAERLCCDLRRATAGATLVVGEVCGVTHDVHKGDGERHRSEVEQRCVTLKDGRSVDYDFLVLATGSSYAAPIKASSAEATLAARRKSVTAAASALRHAKTVVVMGAGAVGVELAGEILTEYPAGKRVVVVDLAPTILPGFHPRSVRYAERWLAARGAELRLGAPLKHVSDSEITLADGEKVACDALYKCTGARPNADFLGGEGLGEARTGPRGSLAVDDHLRVAGSDDVFACGDVCYHEGSKELKLGHTAEVNAHCVALNVLRLARARTTNVTPPPLATYPDDVVLNSATPKIFNLSLGKYDATLGFNDLVVHGPLAAVVKWLLEWTKVAAAANRPVGVAFWIFADFAANLLGRTLLPTVPPPGRKKRASAISATSSS